MKIKLQIFFSPLLLIMLGIFIGELFIYQFFVSGARKKLQEQDKKIKQLEQRLQRLKFLNDEVKKFEREGLEMEAKALRFDKYVPHTIDQVEFLKDLDLLAKENKIKNLGIDILQPEEATAGLYRIPMKLSFAAKFEDLTVFLNALNEYGKLINIEKLNIRREPAIIPYLEVNLTIYLYQVSIGE